MELVDFLRARLDEDEAVARRACEYAEASWKLDEEFGETILWWPPEPRVAEQERKHGLPVTSDQWRGQTIESSGQRIAPHIARHDPARVLREVDAKRLTAQEHEIRDGRCRVCAAHAPDNWTRFRAPCFTLRLLALPYADHPDYRDDWRP